MLKRRLKLFLQVLKTRGFASAVLLVSDFIFYRVRLLKAILCSGKINLRNINKLFLHIRRFGFKSTMSQVKSNLSLYSSVGVNLQKNVRHPLKMEERYGDIENQQISDSEVSLEIVICIHNQLDLVKECLFSVIQNTINPYKLILVNDGSDQETTNWLHNFAKIQLDTTIIENSRALGYVKSANLGLSLSKSSFVILLNSDTITKWDWAIRLVKCARSRDFVGAVGPLSNQATSQTIKAENSLYTDSYYLAPIYPSVGFLNGFCIGLTRRAINEVGSFDEATFSPAFGEENDWCIRAKNLGFQLLVSDDVFVSHVGSASYGTDKARKLELIAHEKLHAKHGAWAMNDHWNWTGKNPSLIVAKKRYEEEVKLRNARMQIEKFSGKVVAIVLCAAHRSGGANVILSEALRLQEGGITIRLINHISFKEIFLQEYPWVESSSNFELAWVDDWEMMGESLNADVVVATLYKSVKWIENSLKGTRHSPIKSYYIQDYEPWFFEKDSKDYQEAKQSYFLTSEWKCFTKTAWNADMVSRETGTRPHIVGKSVELRDFYPGPTLNKYRNRMRIVAMVRPETPRRAATKTIELLNLIQSHYPDSYDIAAFGLRDLDVDARDVLNPEIEIYGQLTPKELRELLQNSDIFVDLSEYQAMGLTALEAMACGNLIFTDSIGGIREFVKNNQNGMIFEKKFIEKQIIQALEEISHNPTNFDEFSFRNIEEVFNYAPEFAARNIAQFILGGE